MSPSLIRCLLAILALSDVCPAVASKDVAQLLGVKRPSVHRATEILREEALIEKEPYGGIRLTQKGEALAHTLEDQRDGLCILFSRRFGLSMEASARAAFALMGVLDAQDVALLLKA